MALEAPALRCHHLYLLWRTEHFCPHYKPIPRSFLKGGQKKDILVLGLAPLFCIDLSMGSLWIFMPGSKSIHNVQPGHHDVTPSSRVGYLHIDILNQHSSWHLFFCSLLNMVFFFNITPENNWIILKFTFKSSHFDLTFQRLSSLTAWQATQHNG